jgi:hypothetical protein
MLRFVTLLALCQTMQPDCEVVKYMGGGECVVGGGSSPA